MHLLSRKKQGRGKEASNSQFGSARAHPGRSGQREPNAAGYSPVFCFPGPLRPGMPRAKHAKMRIAARLNRPLDLCLRTRQTRCEFTTIIMAIYGTTLLSLCLLAGLTVGKLLGWLVGVDANVGGVGIAMLLLIFIGDRLQRSGRLQPPSERGIAFWSSIYIPIVVAMAASQNVLAAIKGGPAAIVAGTLVVFICFALVPLISRLGQSDSSVRD